MLFCFRFNKKALNTVLFSFELRLVQDFSFPFCLLSVSYTHLTLPTT